MVGGVSEIVSSFFYVVFLNYFPCFLTEWILAVKCVLWTHSCSALSYGTLWYTIFSSKPITLHCLNWNPRQLPSKTRTQTSPCQPSLDSSSKLRHGAGIVLSQAVASFHQCYSPVVLLWNTGECIGTRIKFIPVRSIHKNLVSVLEHFPGMWGPGLHPQRVHLWKGVLKYCG